AAGAVCGAGVAYQLFHASKLVSAGVGLVAGVAGLLLAVLLFHVGVFLLGASGGALLVHVLVATGGRGFPLWVYAGAGLAGGLMALLLQRPVISLLTALGGASVVVAGAFQLLGRYRLPASFDAAAVRPEPGQLPLMLVCWIALVVAGAAVQLAGKGKKRSG
ncbi:DUF4203 domain-containing protein, partial [candidate division WOR-3 bacterium]|nr:DUF4203 domain-containing protein [candidate division WOR-3 bacterium]